MPGAGATEIELAKQLTSYGEVSSVIDTLLSNVTLVDCTLCWLGGEKWLCFLCHSPAPDWSSMPSRSLPKPSRHCHVRLLRTPVWRVASSSLSCTLRITRETKTWALISRCVLNGKRSVMLPYVVEGNVFIHVRARVCFAHRRTDPLWRMFMNVVFWSLTWSNTGASSWPLTLPSLSWELTRCVHKRTKSTADPQPPQQSPQ